MLTLWVRPFTSIPVQLWPYPRTPATLLPSENTVWHWNFILSAYVLRAPIPQHTQELHATLQFLPIWQTFHFQGKLHGPSRNPRSKPSKQPAPPPFICAAWQNQPPPLDLAPDKRQTPLKDVEVTVHFHSGYRSAPTPPEKYPFIPRGLIPRRHSSKHLGHPSEGKSSLPRWDWHDRPPACAPRTMSLSYSLPTPLPRWASRRAPRVKASSADGNFSL